MPRPHLTIPAALAASLAIAACSGGGDDAGTAEAAVARAARRDTAREPYREESVAAGGRITGVAELGSGPPPADTSVGAPSDSCGTVRFPLVVHEGARLGEVVVWLDDVRRGKAPPAARRYELSNERCLLTPRVQAALAGGMLNLKSGDPFVHRTRLTMDGDSIAVVAHPDAGSVVPVERAIARPGLLVARSELHPWMRAWIQVFDHPYFAVTERDGRWTLDSVPPGRWRLAAWHPRYGRRDTTVTVEAGEGVEVRVVF